MRLCSSHLWRSIHCAGACNVFLDAAVARGAATTDEAMVILQKTNIPVDVVLGEIDTPGSMNGFGFAQWARSVRPELKILLAATPERTVRNAAELCELERTLKRPYDHKLVLDRIKRLLAARAQQGGR
jgi:two-component SAPR family response regulator